MLTVAVDGSALGNPGPAGWAWYIDRANWAAGGWKNATNNRGELQAVIEILQATQDTDEDLRLLADSQYVINSVTKWMAGWKKKGWKKRDGKDVLNKDLMVRLDELMTAAQDAGRSVTFEWVKGHAGHTLNEAADDAAHSAAEAFQKGTAVNEGPGLSASATGSATDTGSGSATDTGSAEATTVSAADVAADDVAVAEVAAAGDTVTVSCPLEAALADDIVRRAQDAGISPQAELAQLIALGMERKYGK